jgi:hypothetical protein
MTWETFFFACFVFGFVLSLFGFFLGSSHLHLPHGAAHGVHGHGGHGGAGAKFNLGTITVFLTWFGAVGFILTKWGSVGLIMLLVAATLAGVAGAAVIYLLLTRVLAKGDRPLDPADYRIVGALGKVSCTVRPNGTGEMIFVQAGRRTAVPIRSESGALIPLGREVVVTRYEHGIAYVREFEELTA